MSCVPTPYICAYRVTGAMLSVGILTSNNLKAPGFIGARTCVTGPFLWKLSSVADIKVMRREQVEGGVRSIVYQVSARRTADGPRMIECSGCVFRYLHHHPRPRRRYLNGSWRYLGTWEGRHCVGDPGIHPSLILETLPRAHVWVSLVRHVHRYLHTLHTLAITSSKSHPHFLIPGSL